MAIRGWVYIIENDAMPGILKVGFSTKDPAFRAKDLAGTGSPHPFRVVYDALVFEPESVEGIAHTKLRSKREGKEWFRCSRIEAIEVIRASAGTVILEWLYTTDPASIKNGAALTPERAQCGYYGCKKLATSPVKGGAYCDEHSKTMRAQLEAARKKKFDEVRLARDR